MEFVTDFVKLQLLPNIKKKINKINKINNNKRIGNDNDNIILKKIIINFLSLNCRTGHIRP